MQAKDLSTKKIVTEKRRISERIWHIFDHNLGPYLAGGICLAVSGGPDSRALLELLARWPGRKNAKICVVSIDHGLRVSSHAESAYIISRAKILGFDAQMLSLPELKKNDEATLRKIRYEYLWQEVAKFGCTSLVTAHHKDDNVEGQLLYWLGFGSFGHGAMGKLMQKGECFLLRPFIDTRRDEILLALHAVACVDYFLDPTNKCGAKRSQLRTHLLPLLRTQKSDIDERLYEIGQRYVQDKKLADLLIEQYPLYKDGETWSLDYTQMPLELVPKLILKALSQLAPEADLRMSYRVCGQIIKGIDQGGASSTLNSKKELNFAFPKVSVRVTQNRIYFVRL